MAEKTLREQEIEKMLKEKQFGIMNEVAFGAPEAQIIHESSRAEINK